MVLRLLSVSLILLVGTEVHAASVGLVLRNGAGPAIRPTLAKSLELAPNATNAQLNRAWGRARIRGFSNKTINLLNPVLDLAEASGVDVVIAADVEFRGKRRRAKPVKIHLAAIRVSNGEWLGNTVVGVRSRGRGRNRRLSLRKTAPVARFVDGILAKLEVEAPKPKATATDSPSVAARPSPGADVSVRKRVSLAPPKREKWSHANRSVVVGTYGLLHGRTFEYFDTITRNLREFDSGISYGAGVRAEVYPLSFERGSGTTRRIGFTGGYAQDFGISPSVADAPDVNLTHSWSDWNVGAVVAWDFESVLTKATLTYGKYSAEFNSPPEFDAPEELPSVSYQTITIGVGARRELPELAFFVDGQYMFIRRGGRVGDGLFPNAAIGGLRARGGFAYPLFSTVEAFAALQYDHFFYDMRPQRGDTFLAGGALDVHATIELGLSYAY